MKKRQLVSFDWAMKLILRQKANFDILEEFLSELLCYFREQSKFRALIGSHYIYFSI